MTLLLALTAQPLSASSLTLLVLVGLTLGVASRVALPVPAAVAVSAPNRGFVEVPAVAGRATDGPRHPHAPRAPGLR